MKSSPLLSSRMNLLEPEGAYKILSKATELERKGKHIIHFEIGQPDFPTPKNISKAGIDAIKKGYTKYGPSLGMYSLRQEIAKQISETRSVKISPENIAITPSGKTAIFVALSAVLEEGDEVIYPNPSFPTYQVIIDYLGAKRKPIPLLEENSFSFDMKIFRKLFSKKTKLIILNSPSNPTGGIMPKRDLEEIRYMIKGTQTWVMTDEMYAKIVYDNHKYPSFYSFKDIHENTILIDGFSKVYSMTGWRIGYISAPVRIMEPIDYLLTHIAGGTATFTQHAALAGLQGPQNSVKKMLKSFDERRKFIIKELNSIPGIHCATPEGAFYAFPNVKSFGKSSEFIADYLLEKAGVAVLDGKFFGDYGEGYLRLSYATSMPNIKEGLKRIKSALAKLK
jgi:aspartate/methionine/tyrosine aminotransferase